MERQLRLLIVDDHAPDAELEARTVRLAGYDCIWKRVDTEQGLREGLREFQPTLIFSDFSMPRYDGLSALELAAHEAPDTPFIFVSGSLGEKRALHALKLGATDVVPKNDLTRLAPAIARALSGVAARGERENPAERIRRLSGALQMLSSLRAASQQIKVRSALLDEVCRLIFASQQYRYAFVALLNPLTNVASTAAWCGAGAVRGEEARFPVGTGAEADESSTGFVLRTGEPNFCFDIEHYTGPVSAAERRGAELSRSFVALPLSVDGRTLGVLTVGGIRDAMLGEQEMLLLEELAAELSAALRALPDDMAPNVPDIRLDPLTQLQKRGAFCDHLVHVIEAATAVSESRSVVVFDIERLHEINISFGRHVGDRLLQSVAERLKRRFGGSADLAHFGGGTFAAVFTVDAGQDEAARIAVSDTQRIPHVKEQLPGDDPTTAVFGQPFAIGDFAVPVTVKCGVARFPYNGTDPDTLLLFAETSLQRLRERSPAPRRLMRTASTVPMALPELERQLERALEDDHFELHYQPQIDQRSSRIIGVEALLRWNCPNRGMVPPGLFLPTLEASRLMIPMSEWVLARASSDWRRWAGRGLQPLRMAVNVSSGELGRKDFASRFLDASWLHGTSRCWLDIEITESSLIEEPDSVRRTLEILRGEGTRIAIDDFGMGFSSLHRLCELPIDTLKIDRSFVSKLTQNAQSQAIVSAIISLARAYGLQTIAEGVETRAQMQILYSLGCEMSQGFLHSPPLPTEDLEELLGANAAATA